MPVNKTTPEYYATMAVSKLFENESMLKEFMHVYGQSTPDAQAYLVKNLGLPDDMAKKLVSLQGEELAKFVGGNVCGYLW
ncbi:hypothetical protein [Seohaeicola zhoushanensis]|uniref:Uncharacterized protein n=1 Tax=Seohaeicola zhoushanensis TaxID=1569283 RepID=A0A8J3H2T9_9RHOB|nr:hypothetical protein [Seohaeicola zhoushanensis]GHF72942.1 hypothetical protein GCM10017056_49760 [Seohaeicola zhoushanensis]